jgi:hypothetical protein
VNQTFGASSKSAVEKTWHRRKRPYAPHSGAFAVVGVSRQGELASPLMKLVLR